MAYSKSDNEPLRIASKLSDANETFKWYALQIPELTSLQPRVGHALVSLTDGRVLMIGGGNHNGALSDVFIINLEPDTSNKNEPEIVTQHPSSQSFPARYEFFCAKDSSMSCAWVFGGADTENTSSEIIKIDENTIEKLNYPEEPNLVLPCPRTQGCSSALVEYQGHSAIAIFGGGLKGEHPVQDRDLYLFDTAETKWHKINIKLDESRTDLPFACQPPLVQGHAMTAIRSKIFVYGGMNNTTLYDGFHWLDLKDENEESTYSWIESSLADTAPEKPSGRAAHGIARISDVHKNSPLFYMFGGIGEKGVCSDLWSFNVDSMSWTLIMKNRANESSNIHPSPRLDFAMCAIGLQNEESDSLSVFIMVHGGMNREGVIFNDAWIMRVQ